MIESGQTGSRVDIPHKISALKSYRSLIIKRQETLQKLIYEKKLEVPGITNLDNISATITTQIINFENDRNEFINKNKDAYTIFVDFEKIKMEQNIVMVRNRRDGDSFKPINSNGTKKLKKYFIDNKIPRDKREEYPLIAINKEIIWIIGNKTSDKYKVTDNTKSVLMITFTYNKNYRD